jgi:two-component system, sporulation sensor kinase E
MFQLYDNRSRVRWGIVIFAMMIGIVSIFYTNNLLEQLSEREKRQIELFAKGQEFVARAENSADLTFLVDEILEANHTIPVILTDSEDNPIFSRNIDIPEGQTEKAYLRAEVQKMKLTHPRMEMQLDEDLRQFVYFRDSTLITQLKYFPYVQLSVILIFFILVYFIFSASRRAEQNSVWIGLAKETAHQLGTPLSSLVAWIEYFKADDQMDAEIIAELQKDVLRLEMITERFSNIGSIPILKPENVHLTVINIVNYLRKRVSSKIGFQVRSDDELMTAPLNRPLFEWVIENICKNAVDAGAGQINIFITTSKDNKYLQFEIQDTGKGIPPSKFKEVFRPGYTTKKRGWGLGLALVKRIVENYHKGKIVVLRSEINVGTTFQILIPK